MLVVAVSPIIAPTLGGYVTAVLGWRFVFAMLIIVDLIILAGIYFLLPESKKPDPNFSLRPGPILKNFSGVITASAILYLCINGSYLGRRVICLYRRFTSCVHGNISCKRKTIWMDIRFNSDGTYWCQPAQQCIIEKLYQRTAHQSSVNMSKYYWDLDGGDHIFRMERLYSLPSFSFLFFCVRKGFVFPNASALSLASFGHNAGSASALMGTIQMSIGAGTSALVSIFQNHTALPMITVMACCASSGTNCFLFRKKGHYSTGKHRESGGRRCRNDKYTLKICLNNSVVSDQQE
jgi:DHA1 family bicyclomycin/chloramphenicol resistance-like MFS transporter